MARMMRSKGLTTSISTRGSLREILVKPKDKLDKEDLTGVLYHLRCAGCNNKVCTCTYVGETERTAAARFKEHTSTAKNALGNYKSAMMQHAHENGHHFREEDLTILGYEQDWVKRGIKEAAFIKILEPSINLDPGRHTLSSHFDSILSSIITAPPPPPAPHNPDIEERINTAPRRQGRPRHQPEANSQPASSPNDQSQQQESTQPQRQPHSQPLPQRQSQRIRDCQRSQQPSNH